MKITIKSTLALVLALTLVFSVSVPAFATETDECTTDSEAFIAEKKADVENIDEMDTLTDVEKTRGNAVPTFPWDWEYGSYSRSFDIIQYTYTSYCFKPNANKQIYYGIANGQSDGKHECKVKTYCGTCDMQLSEYAFTPTDDFECHRVVTVSDTHADHELYFKIVAYEGGWYFSNNDFRGLFKVGQSYV